MPLYFTLRRISQRDAIALLAELIFQRRIAESRRLCWGRA